MITSSITDACMRQVVFLSFQNENIFKSTGGSGGLPPQQGASSTCFLCSPGENLGVKENHPLTYSQLPKCLRGAWVAQSVRRPTSPQVMVSRCLSSRPASGSVLTAGSREPASDPVSLSLCSSPAHPLSSRFSKTNKH